MAEGTTSRRVMLAGMAALGAGALLWPYTPKSRRTVPRGRVELTYWEKWTGREGLSLQRVIDRFNESQDRIWVHLVPIGDIDAKAMVAIGGGDPPDLVGLYTYNVPGYAEARAVMALDEFAQVRAKETGARLEGLDAEHYAPGVRELLWHEGRQWAGVNTCYSLALYYNKSLLRETGLDGQQPARTIAELDALGERLTRIDRNGRVEQAGFLQNLPGWWPYLWPFLFGGRLFDAGANRATIDEPEGVEAFEWIRQTAARFGVAPTRGFAAGFGRSMHSAQDPFISGQVATIVQGPWLGNFIASIRPGLEYGVAPAPVIESLVDDENPVGLLEADVLMIPRGCPHPEEAYEFLRFHQGQWAQEQLAIEHFKPSPLVRVSDEFMARHPHPGIEVFDRIAKSSRACVLPRTRAWKQYSDLTIGAFDAVWAGADPKVTLGRVCARAQELIDSATLRRRQREGLSLGSLQGARA